MGVEGGGVCGLEPHLRDRLPAVGMLQLQGKLERQHLKQRMQTARLFSSVHLLEVRARVEEGPGDGKVKTHLH